MLPCKEEKKMFLTFFLSSDNGESTMTERHLSQLKAKQTPSDIGLPLYPTSLKY